MDINAFIGKRIQTFRKQKGFSGEDLSKITGLTRSSISNMECGRHRITPEHLYIISCILEISVSEFFPDRKKVKMTEEEVKVEKIKIVRRFDFD